MECRKMLGLLLSTCFMISATMAAGAESKKAAATPAAAPTPPTPAPAPGATEASPAETQVPVAPAENTPPGEPALLMEATPGEAQTSDVAHETEGKTEETQKAKSKGQGKHRKVGVHKKKHKKGKHKSGKHRICVTPQCIQERIKAQDAKELAEEAGTPASPSAASSDACCNSCATGGTCEGKK